MYRATDMTLGRQVAIKILPDAFAADPVSADGQRILMIKLAETSGQGSTAAPPSMVVVEHWTEELKARVPTK